MPTNFAPKCAFDGVVAINSHGDRTPRLFEGRCKCGHRTLPTTRDQAFEFLTEHMLENVDLFAEQSATGVPAELPEKEPEPAKYPLPEHTWYIGTDPTCAIQIVCDCKETVAPFHAAIVQWPGNRFTIAAITLDQETVVKRFDLYGRSSTFQISKPFHIQDEDIIRVGTHTFDDWRSRLGTPQPSQHE